MQKRCHFKIYMKYIYPLFSNQKETLLMRYELSSATDGIRLVENSEANPQLKTFLDLI